MMAVTYPNESSSYREARNALLEAEINLRNQIEEVAAMRRSLPEGGLIKEDYLFTALDGRQHPISSLFAEGQDTLMIYSFMYGETAQAPCPMCVSLIDGVNGEMQHIRQHVGFIAVAAAAPETLTALTAGRGWDQVPFFSTQGTSYQQDYNGVFDLESNAPAPMMNVFKRDADGIRHFWGTESLFADVGGQARHMDLMWPLWAALDMTPAGRGEDWYPALNYQ